HGATTFRLRATGPGTAYAHVWDGRVLGTKKITVTRAGAVTVTVPGATGYLAVAFASAAGGTSSSVAPLTGR
ncbi:MAG: hypothetical protein IRY90_20230, partial [Actinomadura rubrobrunea]|nr:hypothetical protein [Actinomadura rubrobrunea]